MSLQPSGPEGSEIEVGEIDEPHVIEDFSALRHLAGLLRQERMLTIHDPQEGQETQETRDSGGFIYGDEDDGHHAQ